MELEKQGAFQSVNKSYTNSLENGYICSMINRKEDISNSIGRILFMILFFFLISAFAGKSVKPDSGAVQTELKASLNMSAIKATVDYKVQLPLFQKNWVSLTDKENLRFFNENLKILADKKETDQRMICLQQTHRTIKPIRIYRFYYHLFPVADDEWPILS